jgi:hypothetical protein
VYTLQARYPKKLALSYLHDLAKEFSQLFGTQIETTTRPFAFHTQFGDSPQASPPGEEFF